MKKLFDAADVYIKQSDWKDFALVKFCLFSIGLLCGLFVKKKDREKFAAGAIIVFIATYIPLMADFFAVLKNEYEKVEIEKQLTAEE